ncbi:MAG: ribosome silencing factor [Acholeplasma sp.]|nr:ribosome silencing factor [Acholeplasma sp.]
MKKIKKVIDILGQVNAKDIKSFDYEGKSPFFDYIIIATTNDRQGNAVIGYLKDAEILNTERVEGKNGGGWILIDTGDTIIHLFNEEQRKRYNFDERLLGVKELNI